MSKHLQDKLFKDFINTMSNTLQEELFKDLTTRKVRRDMAAVFVLNNVLKPLIMEGVIFSCIHKDNSIRIFSKTDADKVKAMFPAFKISLDERKAKFAELVINYE